MPFIFLRLKDVALDVVQWKLKQSSNPGDADAELSLGMDSWREGFFKCPRGSVEPMRKTLSFFFSFSNFSTGNERNLGAFSRNMKQRVNLSEESVSDAVIVKQFGPTSQEALLADKVLIRDIKSCWKSCWGKHHRRKQIQSKTKRLVVKSQCTLKAVKNIAFKTCSMLLRRHLDLKRRTIFGHKLQRYAVAHGTDGDIDALLTEKHLAYAKFRRGNNAKHLAYHDHLKAGSKRPYMRDVKQNAADKEARSKKVVNAAKSAVDAMKREGKRVWVSAALSGKFALPLGYTPAISMAKADIIVVENLACAVRGTYDAVEKVPLLKRCALCAILFGCRLATPDFFTNKVGGVAHSIKFRPAIAKQSLGIHFSTSFCTRSPNLHALLKLTVSHCNSDSKWQSLTKTDYDKWKSSANETTRAQAILIGARSDIHRLTMKMRRIDSAISCQGWRHH